MARWTVPAVFAASALFGGIRSLHAFTAATANPTTRAGLVVVYYLLRTSVAMAFAAFTLRRTTPMRRSREPVALVACAAAMLLVLPLGRPSNGTATGLVLAGDLIAIIACVWLLASVLVLGRCFGVLPEARGLVVRGPYKLVRHPVYLGEIAALVGLTITSAAPWSFVILGAFVVAQWARMGMEERALTAAFPEYRDYAAQTGRLLPRLGSYKQLPAVAR